MSEFSSCCKTAFKWDGQPTGHEGTIANNKTYIAGTNKEVAVLIIHDLFGWTLPNIRLLADHFAKEVDCTCYVPDIFGGEIIPEADIEESLVNPSSARSQLIDLNGFVARNGKVIRGPEIFACVKALKSQLGFAKVGTMGYCYGGWACFQLGAKEHNTSTVKLVDCISAAHPSLLEKSEIDSIGVPVQVIAPEYDPALTPELKEHCNKVLPGLGVAYQYDYYPGVAHGFASKGDPQDKVQREGLERAKDSAVAWFRLWLH